MNEKTLKIIHTADLHLDAAFESEPDGGFERRREQRRVLMKIAETARDEKADLLLIAGDLFDSDMCYAETRDVLTEAFTICACPVFISPGNHDFLSSDSPYSKLHLPENVYIFKEGPSCISLHSKGVRVYGAGFTDRYSTSLFEKLKTERQEDVFNIGVFHGVIDNCLSAKYNPISPDQIKECGLDYLALGHVHTASGLQRFGNTYYAFPGCPQGKGFDECGDKGFYVITLTGPGNPLAEARFQSSAETLYREENITVPIDGEIMLLPHAAENEILRVRLSGSVHNKPNISALKLRVDKENAGRISFVDETDFFSASPDAPQGSLRWYFEKNIEELRGTTGSSYESLLLEEAMKLGRAALENGELNPANGGQIL